MIRHEVILRIKPEISREVIDRTLGEVRGLLTGITGVERVRYGVNNAPAYRHAMLVVELSDEAALHRFARHPQHTRAVQRVSRLAESSAVGSYLVGSEHHSS
ncbi:MAG TPA: Dabb family protein [Ktedonobacterales bacterium]